jgi:hypothetical protein
MGPKPESIRRRLLIALAFFVILPGAFQFISAIFTTTEVTPLPHSKTIAQSPKASLTPSQLNCIDIRLEEERLATSTKEDSNAKLNLIYSKQRTYLVARIESLYQKDLVTNDELQNIKSLITLANRDGAPISPFLEEYLKAESTIERLLKNKLLKPFFEEEVVDLGDSLASAKNPALLIKSENPDCFEVWDVEMARQLLNIDVKSAWGSKKTAIDFVNVLVWRNR